MWNELRCKRRSVRFRNQRSDQVEPGTGRGSEVQVESWMAMQPTLDSRMLVSGVVVHNQVQVQFAEGLLIDVLEKAGEFLMSMLRHAVTNHTAVQGAQSGKQSGGAVARVVMRHRTAASRFQRQTGLSSVESLNLALLIHAKHQRLVGWIEVKAHHVRELLHELGIATHLKRGEAVGPQAVRLPDSTYRRFADVLSLGQGAGAPVRRVGRLAVQVASTMVAALFASSIGGMRPGRGASFSRPEVRSAKKRSRHRCTVGREMRSSRAMFWLSAPSAVRKMIWARCTRRWG